MAVRVQEEDFDLGALYADLMSGNTSAGAVVAFVGRVRDFQEEDKNASSLRALTLEHYPAMTRAELERIEAEARRRWPLDAVLIVHRYGRLTPGDQIVLVMTAAAHRGDAFTAAEFLMDWLKTKAPFWKQIETDTGCYWVEARTQDQEAAARWTEDGEKA